MIPGARAKSPQACERLMGEQRVGGAACHWEAAPGNRTISGGAGGWGTWKNWGRLDNEASGSPGKAVPCCYPGLGPSKGLVTP